ncbi:MAG: S8 family serine peptidase [Actinobacteria bacterium]|jgi:serine protease AprX|nr:S8 family serine peptidase [Actinomycetota bacterium]
MRTASPSTATIVSLVTALALVLALLAAPPPAANATTSTASLRPTVVDPALASELLSSGGTPLGTRATAIVSAHGPSGLAAIEAAGVTGTRLEALSMLLVDGLSGAQLVTLRDMSEVRSVWAQEELQLHMQESTWVTGAREVWEDHGYTGAGVELGVVDTGADGTHFDFANLIEFCNASATGTLGLVACSTDAASAVDDNGHGTHVAGTMAGTGAASGGREDAHATIGMAPDARIRSYAANVAASLLNTDILAAYDDLITKKEAGENDIVAINNSFGGGIGSDYNPDDPQAIAYQRANEVGMLPVFSAGNSGPEDNTLGVQCLSPYVLCVGASTKTDGITAFSSVGRPAAPHPGADDEAIAYDNHDRRLARAFDIGVYRPGIVAPGAVINAMSANAATCRTGSPNPSGCYEPLQGTSMSAPHVTGAAALVAEAFRDAHRRDPSADELLDILERSAAPLPGHPAEQQGAGRLDVPAAIELALTYAGDGQTEPAWIPVGTPAPNYVSGKHPGGDTLIGRQVGCTGVGSYTLKDQAGVTTFAVPPGAHELTVDVEWGAYHPEANLYLELFRPGHDPANSTDEPGPTRTYPVAESAGLVHTDAIIDDVGPPATSRSVSFAAPEAGDWSLRVTHRTGGTAQPCQDNDNTEETERAEGFSYDVEVNATRITNLPDTRINRSGGGTDTVELHGTATYPRALEGVTTWAAPRTQTDAASTEVEIAEELYFQGGPGDAVAMEGTFGPDEPAGEPPATQTATTSLANDDQPWNPLAITWHGDYTGQIDGNLVFDWWWSTPNLTGQVIGVTAQVTVFADPDPDAGGDQADRVVARQEIELAVGPSATPVRNTNTVFVRGTFEDSLQIQVSPVYVDTGPGLTAYYGAASTPSSFGIPETGGDVLADVDAPQNVRVTDLQDELRIAWDPVPGASGYAIHRSTDPAFTIGAGTLRTQTGGVACQAPNVPSWPGASHSGRCFVDSQVNVGTTYYYRVVALAGGAAGAGSLVGYGTPTFPDRQARVQVDRIFGPGYWEDAETADQQAQTWQHLWDQRGVDDPDIPRARVFSQGVGSLTAAALVARGTDRVCSESALYVNPYSDLQSSNPHIRNVLCMTEHGIAQGYPDRTYRSPRSVTRAQMATFIANLIELERDLPAARSQFDDVGRQTAHWESIHKLARAGVVHGRSADRYDPGAPVTRAQMASFIARAIDYVDNGSVDGSQPPAARRAGLFSDVPSNNVHRAAIDALGEQGISVGYGDGRYGPGDHTRRDQMAAFIMRAYDYIDEMTG